MPKKPDRFERAVEKHVHKNQCNMPVIHAERAASLLRAEHAWMRRKIRRELLSEFNPISDRIIGWNQALTTVLDLLAKRRK